MPDREKVVSRIKTICEICKENKWMTEFTSDVIYPILSDALELLKEQEAKEVEAEVINEIDRLYRCPSCHISMILRGQPYCHSCGQAVKWE